MRSGFEIGTSDSALTLALGPRGYWMILEGCDVARVVTMPHDKRMARLTLDNSEKSCLSGSSSG